MEIRSRDIPGFLHAFTNALSLRGIYIHGVRIENTGPEAHDRFFISDRLGRKILAKRDQESLMAAVALIKQFTHYLGSAPDPAMAIRHFDRLLDKALEGAAGRGLVGLLKKPESLTALARLLGASEFLWEDFLRIQLDNLAPVLREVKGGGRLPGKARLRRRMAAALRRAKTPEEEKQILNARKDREMFRIDMRHLSGNADDPAGFSRALTHLAEAVHSEALAICERRLRKRHGRPRLANGAPCPAAAAPRLSGRGAPARGC